MQTTQMTAMYALNMNTLEHNLLCNGVGARFSLDGKYISANVNMNGGQSVDVISVLQQGTLAELALVCNQQYLKTPTDIDTVKKWVNAVPVSTKAVVHIKRTVSGQKTLQTIYIYPQGRIAPYIGNLIQKEV